MIYATFDEALVAAEAQLKQGGPGYDALTASFGASIGEALDGAGFGICMCGTDTPMTVYNNGHHHPARLVGYVPGRIPLAGI